MLKGKIKDRSERKIWAEYKHGWQLQLRHTTKADFQKLYESATTKTWDPKGFEKNSFDEKTFNVAIAKEVITDWRGLTPDVLRKLCELDEYPDAEVPYSVEDATELIAKLPGLDVWVIKITADWEIFDAARRAEETKNLSSSPAGR